MVLISCNEELHVSNTKRILILATVLQVTMLDNAANLYKTAGAAWCIALATLFHLSLNVITNDPESLTLMKERMKDRLKERNTCKETEGGGGGGEASRDPSSADVLIEFHDQVGESLPTYIAKLFSLAGLVWYKNYFRNACCLLCLVFKFVFFLAQFLCILVWNRAYYFHLNER